MDPLRRCLAGLWGMVVRKCGMDAGGIFRERDTRILSEVVRLSNWRIANGREAGQSKPLKSVPSCVWVSFSTSWGTGQETRIPPPTNPLPTPQPPLAPSTKEKKKEKKEKEEKENSWPLLCRGIRILEAMAPAGTVASFGTFRPRFSHVSAALY